MLIRIERCSIIVLLWFIMIYKSVIATDSEWVLEADSIIDRKVNPVLANGHIGFTVFDTSIYMNGLYNGKGEKTHRARIENHANFQTDLCNTKKRMSVPKCRYHFNIRTGIFEVIYDSAEFKIKHEVFPHRFYTRTIVNRFMVERKNSKDEIRIPVTMNPGDIGLDMTFPKHDIYNVASFNVTIESGHTLEVENIYEKEPQKLTFAFTNVKELYLPVGDYKLTMLAFMTIDHEEANVRKEIARAIQDSMVVEKHEKEWISFWDKFDIEVESRIELAPKVRSSIYYVVSNLPSPNSFIRNQPFYGVSSSGLGNVNDDNQLKGRITWDQEMYILPAVLLINPEWSEDILNYRYRVHAEDPFSEGGWNYFWETAYTGQHLDVFREMVKATHVPADVAFATRLHLAVTQDKQWFRREGCKLAFYTAKYWAARTEYNETTDLYDLKGIRTTSTLDDPITNNAFVNVAVGYNLYLGEFAACMCQDYFKGKKGLKSNWNEIARSLTLPYDDKEEFVKEHSGYEEYIRTTAADMALVNYPLQYPFEEKIKRNTLNHYRRLQVKNSPPTTWASHLISDIELNNAKEESSLFYDINYLYLERPFNIWTDRHVALDRIYNFVSGAAAYLQIYMNGYAGIKIHFDRMEITHPKLPPDSTKLRIKGVNYLSARFDVTVKQDKYSLTIRELPKNDVELKVEDDEGRIYDFARAGDTIELGINSTLTIKAKTYPYGECTMPKNIIGVPKRALSLLPLRVRARANGGKVVIGCLLFSFIAVLCAFAFILYKRHGTIFPNNAVRYVRNV
uniref:CSON002234 protein n=1 Tax=Culicoides sonorensis TaxID=179676 RepID=A0A336MPP1_CULSO